MNWLISLLTGGLPQQLRLAYEARLRAQNDTDRLIAENEIKVLENARLNRLASPENPFVKLAVGLAAVGVCGHLFLVCFVSAFPFWGWTVHALPPPMDQWQGQIILGLFGLAGVGSIARILRR